MVATGITPSGPIHVGNLREVMTADFIYKLLKKKDKKAKFIYIADDFDRLRKVYPFLPDSYKRYVGQPLINVPDPKGCHDNYAQHFLEPFFDVIEKLGVEVKQLSAYQLYKDGKFTEQITTALKNKDKIAQLLEKVSGRDLPDDWQPFNPLCESCGRIDKAKITSVNTKETKVGYKCQACGHEGVADYSIGQGKLPWRIDWPARWEMLGVTVEPFGKEHAASGGSWDTGKAIAKKIYNYEPPYPLRYEFIYLKGSKGKMASSTGNVVAIEDFLEIQPPEIVRYMFASTQPTRHVKFDPGEGMIHLVNDYSKLEEESEQSNLSGDKKVIYNLCQVDDGSNLPAASFRHLVEAYQAAQGDFEEIVRILKETGHREDLRDELALKDQLQRVKTWLEKYAPDKYKFEVQEEVPDVELDNKQKELLVSLAEELVRNEMDAKEVHNRIYQIGEKLDLSARKRFEAVYKALLGQSSGPKAGWFIDILDKEFVIERLKTLGEE